jgi:acyl-coenzyme A thioesterase PaaI-like protein
MEIKTHKMASSKLLGFPIHIENGVSAKVELTASKEMAVDEWGLIHGGFTFSLADYSAMLAINDPFVVLGSAEVKFHSPVVVGDIMRANAQVSKVEGRKHIVDVSVYVGEKQVFSGQMRCYVLSKHVCD